MPHSRALQADMLFELRRSLRSLSLLMEKKAWVFLWIDAVFLLFSFIVTLVGSEGSGDNEFYTPMVLMPYLFLAIPLLSDAVAAERRAGTLDLVLSSPGARFYFERRVGAFALVMLMQGWFVTIICRIFGSPFPLLPALVQELVICFFIASTVLFWALRVRTPASVLFASLATVLLVSPWFFSSPVFNGVPLTLLAGEEILRWVKQNLVLVFAGTVLYLYSLRRMSTPEVILA